MKQIRNKYILLKEILDDVSDIDDFTKADLRKCLAIYVNCEILIAYNQYVEKHKLITTDMIAFFYLHLQMIGAANEALSRGFTDSNPELSRVLFDDTSDGKGAPRLSRFAGAHSTSLTALINDFSPALLRQYMQVIAEIKLEIEGAIVSRVPSLGIGLHNKVKIDFTPMQVVNVSSPQFRVNTQQADAFCLLESVKAIDVIAPLLSAERQDEFCNSHTAQALVIMARQIFANNMFELHNDNDPAFAKLRQLRNCSAHAFVMWEIQNNPLKLRFNCIRLILEMRDDLIAQLQEESPDIHESYVNPQVVKIHVTDESSSSQSNASQPNVQKKKKKPAESKEPPAPKEDNSEFLATRAEQRHYIKLLIIKLMQCKTADAESTLNKVIGTLEQLHMAFPQLSIDGINDAVTATRVKGSQIVKAENELLLCQMQLTQEPFDATEQRKVVTFIMGVNADKYPYGINVTKRYLVSGILLLYSNRTDLLKVDRHLNLLKRALKMAFDCGASPNGVTATWYGERDILSFTIYNNFPREIIELLLEHGANINKVVLNRSYISPLNYAARSRPDIVPLLLEAGANPTDMVYDPDRVPLIKSSLIYDLIAVMDIKINLRLASLRILVPYMYQKFGKQALLTNIDAPIKLYPAKGKVIVLKSEEVYTASRLQTAEHRASLPPEKRSPFVQEDILPCLLFREKVRTVLTNPKLSFYKLILNDEIGIMVDAIFKLASPTEILAAMGIAGDKTETHNGRRFTAVEFALELGLFPLYQYLNRVRAYCYHMVCTAAIINTQELTYPIPSIIADYAMEPGATFLERLDAEQSIASRCL